MNLKRCDEWLKAHSENFMELVRIYLGLGLMVKGLFFLFQPHHLALPPESAALAPFARAVPYVHVIGGALLAAGIFTRLAALAQIPALLGAVFLVNLPRMDTMAGREATEFSALVLFLMVLVLLKGPGELSLSRFARPAPRSGVSRYQAWVNAHSDVFMDAIRVYLGIGLFIKGFYFMDHREEFMQFLGGTSNQTMTVMGYMHYVIPAHFAGGFLLCFGLLTRLAAAVQLPILLGAVFYLYLPGILTTGLRQHFEFSALVLFLLVLITAHGSGRFSVDYLLEKTSRDQLEPQPAAG